MPIPIKIHAGDETFAAELNDSATARAIAESLPFESSASRWGDEYYFSTDISAEDAPERDEFTVGELGFWPPGNAFCIFFGPTPASHVDEPRMANPGISIGRILDDVEPLKSLGGSVPVRVALAEDE